MLTEFQNRGVNDLLIICVDDLQGFSNPTITVIRNIGHCQVTNQKANVKTYFKIISFRI